MSVVLLLRANHRRTQAAFTGNRTITGSYKLQPECVRYSIRRYKWNRINILSVLLQSRNTSVSVRTTLGTRGYGVRFQAPEAIVLFSKASNPVKPPFQRFSSVISSGVKRPGRESTHWGLFISEIKERSCTALLYIPLIARTQPTSQLRCKHIVTNYSCTHRLGRIYI